MKKNKCEVCSEEIVEGFESCWKCDSEEHLSEEKNTITNENLLKIERLKSLCTILIIVSIIFTIVFLVRIGYYLHGMQIFLFILMMFLAFRKNAFMRPGFLAGIFFIGYGLSRCFVELFRQPDQQFQSVKNPVGFFIQLGETGITMGQALSLPMIAIGIILFVTSKRSDPA